MQGDVNKAIRLACMEMFPTMQQWAQSDPDIPAFLAALAQNGWAVVPVEPTRAMTGAAEDADGSAQKQRCGCETCDAAMHEHYAIIWRAMLSAVSAAPSGARPRT